MNSTTPGLYDAAQMSTDLGWQLMRFFIRTTTSTLVYGIFVLLFLHSARVYLSRKQPSKSQHWMFAVTTGTFVLTTINEAVTILNIGLFIHSAFVEDQNSSVITRYSRVINLTIKPNTAMRWFSISQSFISDGIIVWRAYILSRHNRWLITLPLVLLLCSVALMFPFLLGMAMGKMTEWEAASGFVGLGLSLATNVVATSLIGNVYWTHRKDISLGLGAHRITPAERVLALLTESGVMFCMIQTATLIMIYPPMPRPGTPRFYLHSIITSAFWGLSAIYPTAVIALVNSHRTFDQMCSLNTFPQSSNHAVDRNSAAPLHNIVFARPPTTNTTENHD